MSNTTLDQLKKLKRALVSQQKRDLEVVNKAIGRWKSSDPPSHGETIDVSVVLDALSYRRTVVDIFERAHIASNFWSQLNDRLLGL